MSPAFSVHPARAADLAGAGDDLAHALSTDPDGFFLARSGAGVELGRAAGAVRGDTLQLVHLFVSEAARGSGIGRALFDAVRAYGLSRGARAVETVAPPEPGALAFLLKRSLRFRTLALRLRADRPRALEAPLVPVAAGAALSGWVADLDRETRGFSREREWAPRIRGPGGVFALKRRGRPEAVGALRVSGGAAVIGPVEGRTSEAAADLVAALAARVTSLGDVSVDVPVEATTVLHRVFALGFRHSGTLAVLSTRPKGDLRRMAASGTAFL